LPRELAESEDAFELVGDEALEVDDVEEGELAEPDEDEAAKFDDRSETNVSMSVLSSATRPSCEDNEEVELLLVDNEAVGVGDVEEELVEPDEDEAVALDDRSETSVLMSV
jgi:hypothetical protein